MKTFDHKAFEKGYSSIVQFDNLLGMELEVLGAGEIVYRLEVKKPHLTSPDACHGGVVSAMMDATLGLTALSWAVSKGNLCSTVEFKVNYLTPARPGDRLVGTGQIDYAGARLIVTNAKIVEEKSGRAVAKGMGTFSQYPMSKKSGGLKLA